MFVPPKPEYRPLNTGLPQLLRRLFVVVLEGRIVLVVGEDNETTLVLGRLDNAGEPID